MINHPIPLVFDKNSQILILGSFPSVKSREQGFFYGHKQNRFWKVLSSVFKCETPVTVSDKRAFLLDHGVAVWDVIASCDISGSSDDSITNVRANDLSVILSVANLKKIFVNGKTAFKYFNQYIYPNLGLNAVYLPSTSPANASYSLEKLVEEWSVIKE